MQHSQLDHSPKSRFGIGTHKKSVNLCLLVGLIAVLASISGCTRFGGSSLMDWWRNGFKVGPNYARPAAIIADDWIEAENQHVKTDQVQDVYWWTRLEDPDLDQLVEIASQQNLTLQSTGMRILEARAIRGVSVGMLFPQRQTFGGQYLSTLQSTNQGLALPTKSDFNSPETGKTSTGCLALVGKLMCGDVFVAI